MLTGRLVSEAVLATILKHIEVLWTSLGNMEVAQQEMVDMALKTARERKPIVCVS